MPHLNFLNMGGGESKCKNHGKSARGAALPSVKEKKSIVKLRSGLDCRTHGLHGVARRRDVRKGTFSAQKLRYENEPI